MIINGSEAGGGLLRAALPLSVAYQEPLEIVNFRSERREPGLGWPHLAVIHAMEDSGIIEADGAEMGSDTFSVTPTKDTLTGIHIDVNLDDENYTFPFNGIKTERDYDSVEDAFPNQQLINRDGRGVRGHAVSTPLLGFLPLTLSGVTLSLSGGTETPGAPFSDALRYSTIPVLNRLFDMQMGADVTARGTFGVGGGQVQAGNGIEHLRHSPDNPQFITYWSPLTADADTVRARVARENSTRIRSLLPGVELVDIPYDNAHARINQLLLVPETGDSFARDVSLCGEETIEHISGEAFAARVKKELTHRELVSRFHVEQVLLMAAIKKQSGSWHTERVTPHINAVVKLIETITDAEIQINQTAEYATIRVS